MRDFREEQRIDREIHRMSGGTDPFAAAVRATRMPMLITDPHQNDNPIVFVNDAFARLTGYSREETLGRNCRFLQGPNTNPDDVMAIRRAVEGRTPIEIELLNYRKDGSTFWNRVLISPVFDREGELSYFFASQFDVTRERDSYSQLEYDRDALETEIAQRIGDLARAEERLRFTLEAGRLGSWTIDLESRRVLASAICKQNFGRRATDSLSYQDVKSAILAEDFPMWIAAIRQAMAGSGEFQIECRVKTPDDEVRWIEVRGQTTFSADGNAISMAGVTADITERKRAEVHRDLLTRELDHRVKNVLATVQSIFSQTLRNAETLAEAQETMSGRMQALAATHDVLTRENWAGASVGEVVRRALDPFRDSGERIRDDGPRVRLKPRVATALSLAVHELSTNAVKYGALSNDSGTVRVKWDVRDVDGTACLALDWIESGGPPISQIPVRRGFGSRMIERSLSAEIGRRVSVEYRPEGLHFSFAAPLENIRDES